jgi:hypothetical protein
MRMQSQNLYLINRNIYKKGSFFLKIVKPHKTVFYLYPILFVIMVIVSIKKRQKNYSIVIFLFKIMTHSIQIVQKRAF